MYVEPTKLPPTVAKKNLGAGSAGVELNIGSDEDEERGLLF